MAPVRRRVLDPVHGLISFDSDGLEDILWQIIETPSFQRLRRIQQLGFSSLVFPGATHSRFAHAIGVFHVARRILKRLRDLHTNFDEHRADCVLASALLHDIGHGPFSHAIERAFDDQLSPKIKAGLPRTIRQTNEQKSHETTGLYIVLNTEIRDILNRHRPDFASEVVHCLAGNQSQMDLYRQIVSSQFDADRIDYIMRDRMMTGVQSSGFDPAWLIENLEIHDPKPNQEGKKTFVFSSKARYPLENYILALFHLYPNVYLHKTVRAAECLLVFICQRLLELAKEPDAHGQTGLEKNHPLIAFTKSLAAPSEPFDLAAFQHLDDSLCLAALPLMTKAKDKSLARAASGLLNRRLPKCHDLYQRLGPYVHTKDINRLWSHLQKTFKAWDPWEQPLIDKDNRKVYQGEGANPNVLPLFVQAGSDQILDIAKLSPTVKGSQDFRFWRLYTFPEQNRAENEINKILRQAREKS